MHQRPDHINVHLVHINAPTRGACGRPWPIREHATMQGRVVSLPQEGPGWNRHNGRSTSRIDLVALCISSTHGSESARCTNNVYRSIRICRLSKLESDPTTTIDLSSKTCDKVTSKRTISRKRKRDQLNYVCSWANEDLQYLERDLSWTPEGCLFQENNTLVLDSNRWKWS